MGAQDASATPRDAPAPAFHVHPNGTGIDISGWHISSAQLPIATTAVEDRLADDLGIKLPAMLFDRSTLRLEHVSPSAAQGQAEQSFQLVFSAVDALRMVGDADPNIKVKAAVKWGEKTDRDDVEITTIDKASDWTFSTRYPGTVTASQNPIDQLSPTWEPMSQHLHIAPGSPRQNPQSALVPIDYDVLRNTELPILFSSEVILFEDELDDNGVASFKVRIRVMPSCFFILARFFLRVDGVLVRIFDTRYFHRFGTAVIVRESMIREGNLASTLKDTPSSLLKDPDMASQKVPAMSTILENIHLPR